VKEKVLKKYRRYESMKDGDVMLALTELVYMWVK
jgi:hypothetical protein